MGLEQQEPTVIWEDNASAIMMSENPVNQERSRHIDTQLYCVCDLVQEGVVKLVKCAGTHNVADALTKSVPFTTLDKHCEYLFGSRVPFSAFWISVEGWRDVAVFALRM